MDYEKLAAIALVRLLVEKMRLDREDAAGIEYFDAVIERIDADALELLPDLRAEEETEGDAET